MSLAQDFDTVTIIRWNRISLLLVSVGLAVVVHAGSPQRIVTDDSGRKVSVGPAPLRIVSLAPGATELLFAAGALVAMVTSAAGAGTAINLVVFLLVSVVALGALRPVARSHRRQPALSRTGTAALVGKHAMVLERIANDEGVGCVRLDGEVWTARAYDEDYTIAAGTKVTVVAIRGATALVAP